MQEEIYSSSYAAAAYLESIKFPKDKKVLHHIHWPLPRRHMTSFLPSQRPHDMFSELYFSPDSAEQSCKAELVRLSTHAGVCGG